MKRNALMVALVATLALCAWLALQGEDELLAAAPPRLGRGSTSKPRMVASSPAAAVSAQDPARRGPWAYAAGDAVAAWSAPPAAASMAAPSVAQPVRAAPAAAPPSPPPLRAPAFGFELIGTVLEGQARGALIQSPQRSLWVRAGDTVDGAWRVETVQADSVDLLWLPQRLPGVLRYRTP